MRRLVIPGSAMASSAGPVTLESRSVGVLLGLMCGDALGATPEGEHMSAAQIARRWPGGLRSFARGTRLGLPRDDVRVGDYTDDANSALALASSLVRVGGLDVADCARSYAEFWTMDPERGYPGSAQLALAAVAAGADPLLTGRLAFPGGSFANGGAMRIAPLGIAFRRAGDAQLRFAVRCAVVSSHVHAQGVDGAVVVAKAIALLVAVDAPAAFRPLAFLDALLGVAKTAPMRRKLATLRRHFAGAEGGVDGDGAPRADPASALWPAVAFSLAERDETGADRPRPCGGGARDAHDQLRARPWFQIRATTAVACAVWAFLDRWREPEEALVGAVALGGDADTVGAMCGAMCGALHGDAWLPARWLGALEDRPHNGKAYAARTARALAALDLTAPLDGSALPPAEEDADDEGASDEESDGEGACCGRGARRVGPTGRGLSERARREAEIVRASEPFVAVVQHGRSGGSLRDFARAKIVDTRAAFRR